MTEHVDAPVHLPGTQKVYQACGMEYYLYLPPGYRRPGDPPPVEWPVILFLHGIGEASQNYNYKINKWVQQSIDVVKSHNSPAWLCATRPSKSQRLLNSFIVISPQFPFVPNERQKAQGRQGRTWQWADRVDTITHILDVVTGQFNGSAKRIYATGFSKGGRGALALAEQYSIAKLVLVDSQSVPTTLPDRPTWVHYSGSQTLENIVNEHQGLIQQLDQGVWKNAPADAPAPPSQHLFTNWNLTLPSRSENHTDTSRCAYSDPRVYEWLLYKD